LKNFKCGVEIHQRLDSHKLYCNCYSNPSSAGGSAHGALFKRGLRAVAGELGGVDRAARFQAGLGKTHEYFAPYGECCLVECDDEPPREMNREALAQALRVAKSLEMECVDEVRVMRKTVVDGSAVSGFQRTALIALTGTLETSRGPVGVDSLCLEEESAAITPEGYRLDRLGIPLIEIATAPDIKDGVHCREVCEKIGLLLRSVARVQRGIGSIRQDVNVSIEGGARVEIKGVQDLKALPELVDNEVKRQEALIALKGKRVNASPVEDWSAEFASSPCRILAGKKVYGFQADCPGLLKTPVHEGKTLGNELAGYARASGARGVIHSDEDLTKYCLEDFPRKGLWIVCSDNKAALEAVRTRLLALGEGVPEETRRADGSRSEYMRPLAGGARMYPETDLSPVRVTRELFEGAGTGKGYEERVAEYIALGVGRALAEKAARSEKRELFESLAKEWDAKLVAGVLLEKLVELKRGGATVVGEEGLRGLFALHAQGLLTRAGLEEALSRLAKAKTKEFKPAIEKEGLRRLSPSEVERLAREFKGGFAAFMAAHRLNADPSDARKAFENG